MYLSGFFSLCDSKSRWWMCACATLLGKQGSMLPYLPPLTHSSSVVSSLKTTPVFGMPMASK
jgi:hypothetical protein